MDIEKAPAMSEKEWVVGLGGAMGNDVAALGGKAASLARLIGEGFPVPAAYCVAAQAYSAHLADNRLLPKLDSLVKTARDASATEADGLLADFRASIERAPLDDALAGAIAAAYDDLKTSAVAVRSSATTEDLPGHSFAGQYDTFLGVATPQACMEAVKRCWASLWTRRAFDYREKHGFDHRDARMAVIVQAMVPADASGVLFTADPATGRRDRVVLEACFGLGETLVSGKVSPDRFMISRGQWQVLEHAIGEKWVESRLTSDGTVVETEVSESRRMSECIDEACAVQLAKLGVQVEALYGAPMDIEWAIANARPFVLQARPITALPAVSWEDRQVWTNANTGEVVPDVLTPMTWSIIQVLLDALLASIKGWVGVDFQGVPLVGLIGGRVYFNVNTMVALIRFLPGMQNQNVGRLLGGAQEGKASFDAFAIPQEDIPEIRVNRLKVLLKTLVFALRMLTRSGREAAALLDRMRRDNAEIQARNLSAMSEKTLATQLATDLETVRLFAESLALSGTGIFWFTHLDRLCNRWFGAEGATYANRLLAGTGGMDSAEAGLDLWRLATDGHAHADVEAILLEKCPWEAVRAKLEVMPEGNAFLASWAAFMTKHGHHTRGELEVYNPRWHETPDYILETVRVYLRALDSFDAMAKYRQRTSESEALAAQCRRRLKNPFKRAWFNLVLNRAKRGSLIRENIKSGAVRYWSGYRAILLEIGKRLVERGVLADSSDVFFLSLAEVKQLTHRQDAVDFRDVVLARRAEYDSNQAPAPPGVVMGRWHPSQAIADAPEAPAEVYRGIPVSPGVVTGPARVIPHASSEAQVLPGEILVAPFTDPGWTPYFMTAAAIVMDQGGMLSHGSIVAREYGIPAVVNVGAATKNIRTGQILEVDGTRGTVRCLEPNPEPR